MTACAACCLDPQDSLTGSNRTCAFVGDFSDNWCCGTISMLRELVFTEYGEQPHPLISTQYADDATFVMVNVDACGINACVLFMEWYKQRGSTRLVYLIGPDGPRLTTEDECLTILTWFDYHPAAMFKGRMLEYPSSARPASPDSMP